MQHSREAFDRAVEDAAEKQTAIDKREVELKGKGKFDRFIDDYSTRPVAGEKPSFELRRDAKSAKIEKENIVYDAQEEAVKLNQKYEQLKLSETDKQQRI